jgi:Ser/Thr protein kinase RdoA (MazF antagonist)
MTGPSAAVLAELRVRADGVRTLKDVPGENASWLVRTAADERVVLRRYHAGATGGDLAYEHAVLCHLAGAGWVVPEPVSDVTEHDGRYYCLTRFVPGRAVRPESVPQRCRRGRDLARLHLALRDLGPRIGQRPGWRPQHAGPTVHTGLDWAACVSDLLAVSPRLGEWAQAAATQIGGSLAAIGASALPLTVVHGDFAEWNVHYGPRDQLAGVIDFGLTHLDSRPYELAIARTYRAPQAAAAYGAELAALGWPLTDLEQAAIEPVYRAFRLDQAAWSVHDGLRAGQIDLAAVERHLVRTGTPAPG